MDDLMDLIEKLIDHATEHLDGHGEMIDEALGQSGDVLSEAVESLTDKVSEIDNLDNVQHSETAKITEIFKSNSANVESGVTTSDMDLTTLFNEENVDKSIGQSDPSFGSRLTTVAEHSHHDPVLDGGQITEDGRIGKSPISEENSHVLHFTGNQAEDNEYWAKRAEHAQEEATFHTNEAKKAADRGDFSSAKDHERTASSWQSDANRYRNNIK